MSVCCECCVFCQVEVFTSGLSLVQSSDIECGVCVCIVCAWDHEAP
jgi:hypothetical protein